MWKVKVMANCRKKPRQIRDALAWKPCKCKWRSFPSSLIPFSYQFYWYFSVPYQLSLLLFLKFLEPLLKDALAKSNRQMNSVYKIWPVYIPTTVRAQFFCQKNSVRWPECKLFALSRIGIIFNLLVIKKSPSEFCDLETMSGRGKGGKVKGKAKSRWNRAGLQFPVGRIHRLLRKGNYAERVGAGEPVYLAAVMECGHLRGFGTIKNQPISSIINFFF